MSHGGLCVQEGREADAPRRALLWAPDPLRGRAAHLHDLSQPDPKAEDVKMLGHPSMPALMTLGTGASSCLNGSSACGPVLTKPLTRNAFPLVLQLRTRPRSPEMSEFGLKRVFMLRRTVAVRRACKPGMKHRHVGEARKLRFGASRLRRPNRVNSMLSFNKN
jgi:hypothetical protein